MEDNNELMMVPGMTHDLGGGFQIRRLLPYRKKRMVGPFIFLDHMGPVEFTPNSITDIRPHPHIGLSTLTYLYSGRMVHRDSVGSVQTILPGEVNWMTSGSGIVHSERAHQDDYGNPIKMEGLQFWVALPDDKEDGPPSFYHYDRASIPTFKDIGFNANVVVGSAFGLISPVESSSPSVFIDVTTDRKTDIPFSPEKPDFEIAIYVLKGKVTYINEVVEEGHLAICMKPMHCIFKAEADTHFIIIGGEAFPNLRYIFWNFVSSSHDKIEAAKKRWKEGKFEKVPGDDKEFIPLGD